MAVIKKLAELAKFFNGYKGRVVIFEGRKAGEMIARRESKSKYRPSFRRRRFTELVTCIMGVWQALEESDPACAAVWNKAAKFYRRWYAVKVPFGERFRYRNFPGADWQGFHLFAKCNVLGYYAGFPRLCLKAPTLKDKIPQPEKPQISFDRKTKSVLVKCQRPDLPDGVSQATIEVWARVQSTASGSKFQVGCIDTCADKLEIGFSKFKAKKMFFGKVDVAFKEVFEAKVQVWTYTIISQGNGIGVLDSQPSPAAELTLPPNLAGRKLSNMVRRKKRSYERKLKHQLRKIRS